MIYYNACHKLFCKKEKNMPNTTKTINKVEPVNPESDNNNGTPASLTSELAKDIKTFTTAVKSNLANVTAIFPFIAVGI
jgi:hypothetical protein